MLNEADLMCFKFDNMQRIPSTTFKQFPEMKEAFYFTVERSASSIELRVSLGGPFIIKAL